MKDLGDLQDWTIHDVQPKDELIRRGTPRRVIQDYLDGLSGPRLKRRFEWTLPGVPLSLVRGCRF